MLRFGRWRSSQASLHHCQPESQQVQVQDLLGVHSGRLQSMDHVEYCAMGRRLLVDRAQASR